MATLTVPRSLGEITPDWLTEALGSAGPSVTGYRAEVIAQGAGFMNQLYRLRPVYDRADPSLPDTIVVKLPSSDPLLNEVTRRLGSHQREVGFYRELADNPHLPAPRCYYSSVDPVTGDTVLLLEDMSHARQGDSVAGCIADEAHRAIVQLAKFHAGWWNSPALEGLEWMPCKDAEAELYQGMYPGAWQSLLESAGSGMPGGLRRLADWLQRELPKLKAELAAAPRTIVHGDYRLDNCFFAFGAEPRPPVVIDWEFCARGRGVCDVATFTSETFPPLQRREVEPALVRTYHSVLTNSGVTGYSFEQCWHDYRLAMLELFAFWIVTGGYCNYDSERAKLYLHNTLERIDAAISDLASVDLLTC